MNSNISNQMATRTTVLVFAILGSVASAGLFVFGAIMSFVHSVCMSAKSFFYYTTQPSCSPDQGPGLFFGGFLCLVISIVLFVYYSNLNKQINMATKAQSINNYQQ